MKKNIKKKLLTGMLCCLNFSSLNATLLLSDPSGCDEEWAEQTAGILHQASVNTGLLEEHIQKQLEVNHGKVIIDVHLMYIRENTFHSKNKEVATKINCFFPEETKDYTPNDLREFKTASDLSQDVFASLRMNIFPEKTTEMLKKAQMLGRTQASFENVLNHLDLPFPALEDVKRIHALNLLAGHESSGEDMTSRLSKKRKENPSPNQYTDQLKIYGMEALKNPLFDINYRNQLEMEIIKETEQIDYNMCQHFINGGSGLWFGQTHFATGKDSEPQYNQLRLKIKVHGEAFERVTPDDRKNVICGMKATSIRDDIGGRLEKLLKLQLGKVISDSESRKKMTNTDLPNYI